MRDPDVKKIPSALKWLAEMRARLAHELGQLEKVKRDVDERVERLRHELSAVDRTIGLYDGSIDPNSIRPVNGWAGTYGKRGTLLSTIEEVLAQQAPNWVSTHLLEAVVCTKLGLTFDLPVMRTRWRNNSLRPALRVLIANGRVERLQDPTVPTAEVGHWRLKPDSGPSLAHLQQQADAQVQDARKSDGAR